MPVSPVFLVVGQQGVQLVVDGNAPILAPFALHHMNDPGIEAHIIQLQVQAFGDSQPRVEEEDRHQLDEGTVDLLDHLLELKLRQVDPFLLGHPHEIHGDGNVPGNQFLLIGKGVQNPYRVEVVASCFRRKVHDFLCVLLSGNKFLGKLSSDDRHLVPALAEILTEDNPEWDHFIRFTREQIHSFDSVIATGSNNSSNYFQFYFSKYPHIIRKNRNSIAILTGAETTEDLANLAIDVFLFFGLGCRNISKIYVPEGYDFSMLILAFSCYEGLLDHHKYRNNYDYFKAIFQLNLVLFVDAKSTIMKEDSSVSSPISVLNYQYYASWDKLVDELSDINESIQCIVSKEEVPFRWFKPGKAQTPELWDYADGLDTMKFLIEMGEAGINGTSH